MSFSYVTPVANSDLMILKIPLISWFWVLREQKKFNLRIFYQGRKDWNTSQSKTGQGWEYIQYDKVLGWSLLASVLVDCYWYPLAVDKPEGAESDIEKNVQF